MGCGSSVEDNEQKKRNDEIEQQIRKDKGALKNEVKMLLLGIYLLLSQRNWRIRKINYSKTNEIDPHEWIYKGRTDFLS